ncbi:MAG: low specificity L-threonine aldolase [Solobacterium sp.]|nr:low specificity L-threonine aldolase [Solobacterium sp.]
MIRFDSDYIEGCIPEILEALAKTNSEQTVGYGEDPHCEHARELIRKAIGKEDADVHFLVGGTQANTTVIASVLRPHQGALCAETGHIACHETGALEAAGHKCLTLPTEDGTITAEQVEAAIQAHYSDESFEHIVQPGLVYISYPTESGTLYSRTQLKALYETCQKYDIPLFIDGARLGYGLCSRYSDLTMQDIASFSDIFYIGGTKVGALFGEAVVITNPKYKKDFRYHIKQRGGMLAKGRMLGIQFEELFTDDRYMKISRHAIAMAEKLTDGLRAKGVEFRYEAVTNQIFPVLSNAKIQELRDAGFSFHTWGAVDEDRTAVRFVTSFMTPEENIEALLARF